MSLTLGFWLKFLEITLHSQILMLPAFNTCSMETMEIEFGLRESGNEAHPLAVCICL